MRKHITKIGLCGIACLMFAGSVSAQIYSENFDGVTAPELPAGMTERNMDGSTPDPALATLNFGSHGWVTAALNGGGNAVISYSYKTPQADDWLRTPAIIIPSGTYGITWKGKADYAAPNNDGYEVRVSITDTAIASFTDVVFSTPGEVAASTFTTHYADLSAYSGKTIYIAFRNNSANKTYVLIDDLVVDQALALDAKLVKVTAGKQYVAAGASDPIGGTIENKGGSAITSVDVYWQVNGGTATKETLNSLNIAPMSTYDFTLSSTLSRPTVGTYVVKAWIGNINGAGADGNALNDSTGGNYYAVSSMPAKSVVIEEGTGTWCGWCPRGAVYMDSIAKVHPGTTVLIAVHNGDPMAVGNYDAGIGSIISGYPSVVMNRNIVDDPSNIFTQYDNLSGDFGMADIAFTASYNAADQKVTGNVSASFAADAVGDFRLAMVITEDSVTGTGSSYNQVNYYSSQSQNIPLSGAGHNWQAEPSSVPASKMQYDFVARESVGGFDGQTGSLPSNIPSGSVQTYSFTSSALTTVLRPNKIKAHVLLIDAGNKVIYNARTVDLSGVSGITNVSAVAVNNIKVFPNPVQNELTVGFGLDKNETVNISIVNAIGQTVYNKTAQNCIAGKQEIKINTTSLTKGVYFIQVGTSKGVVSKRFVKANQ